MNTYDDEYRKYLRGEIDYYGRYHDHKETMAWVATAFYLAGAMYLGFKARWLCEHCGWAQALFVIFFVFAGYLVFCFVKWQFDRRWEAHVNIFNSKVELDAYFIKSAKTKPKLNRDCKAFLESSKYLSPCRVCSKNKDLPPGQQPIKSELITYIAIIAVTIVAILLVVISNP